MLLMSLLLDLLLFLELVKVAFRLFLTSILLLHSVLMGWLSIGDQHVSIFLHFNN